MGEESNPIGGIQMDPVVNCNSLSEAIFTFLDSVLRKISICTFGINKYNSQGNNFLYIVIERLLASSFWQLIYPQEEHSMWNKLLVATAVNIWLHHMGTHISAFCREW